MDGYPEELSGLDDRRQSRLVKAQSGQTRMIAYGARL